MLDKSGRIEELRMISDVKRYIESRVDMDPTTQCWNWRQCTNLKGYGVTSKKTVGYKEHGSTLIHRIAYMEYKNTVQKDMLVLHTCDNPKCCNPEHLYEGTAKDNADDMISRGRAPHGERHPNAILNASDVVYIRYSDHGLSSRQLADKFGVARVTIRDIIQNRKWRHVKMDTISNSNSSKSCE